MDDLNTLGGGLPSQPRRRTEQRPPNAQLFGEFKTAATAVAKLFNLSSQRLNDAYEQGYVDALRALLDVLDEHEGVDARAWALDQLLQFSEEQDRSEDDADAESAAGPSAASDPSAAAATAPGSSAAALPARALATGFAFDSSDDEMGDKRVRPALHDTKRSRVG